MRRGMKELGDYQKVDFAYFITGTTCIGVVFVWVAIRVQRIWLLLENKDHLMDAK
jgi:hypothetical protein